MYLALEQLQKFGLIARALCHSIASYYARSLDLALGAKRGHREVAVRALNRGGLLHLSRQRFHPSVVPRPNPSSSLRIKLLKSKCHGPSQLCFHLTEPKLFQWSVLSRTYRAL